MNYIVELIPDACLKYRRRNHGNREVLATSVCDAASTFQVGKQRQCDNCSSILQRKQKLKIVHYAIFSISGQRRVKMGNSTAIISSQIPRQGRETVILVRWLVIPAHIPFSLAIEGVR